MLNQTLRENHSAFHKIWFRPRVLVDVENIDMSTIMLGTKVSVPFYVTATALGKLGNPEGEVILTRGARKHNVSLSLYTCFTKQHLTQPRSFK